MNVHLLSLDLELNEFVTFVSKPTGMPCQHDLSDPTFRRLPGPDEQPSDSMKE
jgi:hypothetical protein